MKYVAGLDGLRAIAVLVVLLFHAEVTHFEGGFLGVSLFFTLSGFLITSLLLAEHGSKGTISLRGFYGRRARRLLPAAYVCLAAVAASASLWSAAQLRPLGGDLLAAVSNVANWRFALSTTSYSELFTSAPSPVAHFWSLAIEEQVYLVLPLVVALALRRGRRLLLVVTGALLIASLAATLLSADRDLVYNGTHTRIAEVLVGMFLAQLVVRRSEVGSPTQGRWSWIPGAAALVAFGCLVVTASIDQGWIYRGGLPFVAVVSALIIWAVNDGRFPAQLLALGPLVAIGRVSYGIYLFHWPVFLLLDAERVGAKGAPLFAVRCLVTGVLTVISYRMVEQPVRTRRVLAGRAMIPAAGLAAVAIAVVAAVAVPTPKLSASEQLLARGGHGAIEFGSDASTAAGGVIEGLTDELVPADASGAGATTADVRPLAPASVVVVGSDPAVAPALSAELGEAISVTDATRPQCPLSAPSTDGCTPLIDVVTPAFDDSPALVVFSTGSAESIDSSARRAFFTEDQLFEFNAIQYSAELLTLEAIDAAKSAGARVVWYSSSDAASPYDRSFQTIGVMRPELTMVQGPVDQLVAVVDDALAESAATEAEAGRLHLLVIGDSTSLYFAAALSEVADDRLSVFWAGEYGCPVADAVAVSWTAAAEWLAFPCPRYEELLPSIVQDFRPDAVLLMTGPPELQNQKYADGSVGVAGDANYAAHSQANFQRILDGLGSRMPILIADLPELLSGPSVSDEMKSAERLDAANAQVAAWATRYRQVEKFAYADTLEAAEAREGSLRADGMHPDVTALGDLVREVYLDRLLAQIDELRAILPS